MSTLAPHSLRRYATGAILSALVSMTCVVLFTLSTDPYKLRPPSNDERSVGAIDLFYHLRLHKPYAIERLKPSHLIAGSSRSARFSPKDSNLIKTNGYNAALPGASLKEIRRVIEHAQVTNEQQRVIVGLDYYMFTSKDKADQGLLVGDRFLAPNMSLFQKLRHYFQHFEDTWRSLLSVDSVLDSIRARTSARSSAQLYQDDGTWEIKTTTLSSSWMYSALARQVYQEHSPSHKQDFSELRALLAFLDEEKIETHLIIAPMNGLLLEAVKRAGAWEQYLNWQRQLTGITSQYEPLITLYGLEDRSELTLEKVDAREPNFRDGVHLTRRASAEIYECITDDCTSSLAPTKLTPRNLEAYLKNVDRLRLRYLRENPKQSNKLSRWLVSE
ncbi:MAG: hypothetical protein AB8B48_11045 [Pseudomonadales bacterium]